MNAWWDKLGFNGKAPLSDTDMQSYLDAFPHYTLTWYNQPSDTAHPYSAALITVRDGKRVINLNLSQAPDYNSYTPYYPAPFSDNLAYGTTDLGYALMIPQVTYNGKTYIPVTYYRNLNVQETNGQVVVTFDTAKFRQAAKNALYTTANSDGYSVSYANGPATNYAAMGFDSCAPSQFDTVNGATNPLSTTPIGQLHSNFACTTNPFALSGGASRTLTWTLKYADPA
ncbi:hypothetical protein OKW46_006261 [Paraburkholderia sp. WSM4179]|nr:hypothetical protein [Paraburkholderia sp. WSM4179]